MVLQTLDKQLRDAEAALEVAKEREAALADRPKVRAAEPKLLLESILLRHGLLWLSHCQDQTDTGRKGGMVADS